MIQDFLDFIQVDRSQTVVEKKKSFFGLFKKTEYLKKHPEPFDDILLKSALFNKFGKECPWLMCLDFEPNHISNFNIILWVTCNDFPLLKCRGMVSGEHELDDFYFSTVFRFCSILHEFEKLISLKSNIATLEAVGYNNVSIFPGYRESTREIEFFRVFCRDKATLVLMKLLGFTNNYE